MPILTKKGKLIFFFIRPDGSINCATFGHVVTPNNPLEFPEEMNLPEGNHSLEELNISIKSGESIYSKSPVARKRHTKRK